MVAVRKAEPRPLLREVPRPEQRPYEPVGAALDLMLAKEDEVLIEGPAGTGKSRNMLEKFHLCAEKYPGMRALLVRKTRASMTDSTLVTFENEVLPLGSPVANGPARKQRHSYDYDNGSEIVIAGIDTPSKIMSTQYDMIGVDEATELTEDDWESLTTRNRNGVMPYQQCLAACNPGPPSHWLNQRANAGRIRRLVSRHEHNLRMFRRGRWTDYGETYMKKLRALTGVRRKRLLLGLWAMAEGMVYEDWDAEIHLINPLVIPDSWRRFRVIDFGFRNAFVCGWFAIDGDGRLYRYREIYMTGRIVADHAKKIREWSEGESYECTIADHDAEDRATLHKEGIQTLPAFKSVSRGIQAVQARLRKQDDGRPRLYLVRDALVERDPDLIEAKKPWATEQEIEGYIWATGANGKLEKDVPVKEDDHGCDVLRYASAYADGLGPRLVQRQAARSGGRRSYA